MKKILLLGTILLSVLVLSGCSSDLTAVTEIDYNQLQEKIDKKDSFILEVIQTGCPHCEKFAPEFRSILYEHKITAFSLNLSNLTKEENKKFDKIAHVSGTPTVLFFQQGKEQTMYRLVGAASESEILKQLKNTKYIK